MNNMKRFASLLLALVMVLAMAAPAMAAESTAKVDNQTSHTYWAYQIFTGTQAENAGALGDVEWGNGINDSTFLAALQDDTRFEKEVTNEDDNTTSKVNVFDECTTAAQVAEALADNTSMANAFAEVAAAHVTTVYTVVPANGNNITLETGYYVVVDQTNVSEQNDAQNPALLQVVQNGDFTIGDKYDVPEVDKEIDGEEDAADANIGDVITFTLTATMPSDLTGYETYKLIFNDTMSKGLTFNNDVTVKIGDTEISATVVNEGTTVTNYTVNSQSTTDTTAAYVGGTDITVTLNDVLALGATTSSTVTVTYTATLNENAVIGYAGNPNKVDLEYSNDPDVDTLGKTPEDEVIVFTYELDVTKVDGDDDSKKLSEAQFVLLSSDKQKVATVVNDKITGWIDVPAAVDGVITWPANTTLTSDANGLFEIAGLDAGTYYLRETKAPAGYNLLTEDIKIVITATITDTEETQSLDKLEIAVNEGTAVEGTKDTSGKYTGVVNATVENNAGRVLPETGGMGTTLFYAVGGLLVAGAVVVLMMKKRNAA